MLADDVPVAGGGGDAELLREQVAEARRVQVGPGAEYAVLGQSAQLPRHVRQDVHWVTRDYQDGVRAVFHQLRGADQGYLIIN